MFMRLLSLVALLAVAGCQTVQTTKSGAVGVERQQLMMVSAAQVEQGATKAYAQVVAEADKRGLLNKDAAQTERVRGIARRLTPQTGEFRSDAPSWKWEINVITSKQVNAWCMPGGKIAVYTGLIEKLQATDDELAAVMGHEIAHALREHGRERASQAQAQGIAIGLIGVLAGFSGTSMNMTQLVVDMTFNLPNSREHETEADRIGVELAARAGYDPRGAISLWEKMGKLGGGQPPEFLSTHPANTTRIADLKAYSEKVMPLYETARPRR
jgi:predicted Zn-dependent protease